MSDRKEVVSDYEKLRLNNIEENRRMMQELGLLSTQNSASPPPKQIKRPKSPSTHDSASPIEPIKKRPRTVSELLSSAPGPKRRSRRIASLNPEVEVEVEFTLDVAFVILGDTSSCVVSRGTYGNNSDMEFEDDDDNNNIEKENENFKKAQRRRKSSCPRRILSPDEITDEDLSRVFDGPGAKVYCSETGTTCHQCRQKTVDQKTVCRSKECVGVRGQVCGICLSNRYGESVVEALKNPEWTCPVCRGVCNCSICRGQSGKPPTGQMYPYVQMNGYPSVHHYLDDRGDVV